MRRLILILALLLVSAPAWAQSVPINTPFKLAADSPGTGIATYRLYRNGVVVASKAVASLTAGVITFDEPGLPAAGPYIYELSAIGDGVLTAGESKSLPLTVTATLPAPPKPGNLRFTLAVVVADDGTVTFHLVPEVP